ncbi:MAG: tetratricopeptide repeat protein [Chloroflexi bacterium]|nr:tetratricopeptide repeat protein [Chloroflexota bacterium]
MSNLGLMYNEGRGVPRNDTEAVRLFQQVALRGLPEAMHNLGGRYWKGEGVGKDRVYAYAWLVLAAQNI